MLLNVPKPEKIDQVPIVAPPPILEPLKIMALGNADWQTVFGPPAVAVGKAFTVTNCVTEFVQPPPVTV